MAGPVVVTLDIETAPLDVYTWGIWEQDVGLDMITQEWSILSYSAKRLGNKRVEFHYTGNRGPDKVRDDRDLCIRLRELLDNADIVVTQNGQAFDIKKINGRLIMHGLGPYSPIRVIDTKLVAKRYFGFTSNRLEWMGRHVNHTARKDKHKKFPGFELWAECLRDNPKAWAEMRRYNSQDVIATEELYLHMRPWIANHPNMAVYANPESRACPRCASTRLQQRGRAMSQSGEYLRWHCQSCGGWSRSKSTLLTAEQRSKFLVGQ